MRNGETDADGRGRRAPATPGRTAWADGPGCLPGHSPGVDGCGVHRHRDLGRVERLLDGDDVIAVVAATPAGALPDTLGAVIARSLGMRRSRTVVEPRWDAASDAFVATSPPIDLGARREVLIALTGRSHLLVVLGLDRLGRPVETLWSIPVTTIEAVAVEPTRLLGVSTDALVIASTAGMARFALARPHRRAGRDLAALIGAGVPHADG